MRKVNPTLLPTTIQVFFLLSNLRKILENGKKLTSLKFLSINLFLALNKLSFRKKIIIPIWWWKIFYINICLLSNSKNKILKVFHVIRSRSFLNNKLERYGFRNVSLVFIKAYLSRPSHFVCYNTVKSSSRNSCFGCNPRIKKGQSFRTYYPLIQASCVIVRKHTLSERYRACFIGYTIRRSYWSF